MNRGEDGLRLTVTWEFAGKPSVERALRFAEKWMAGALEIDASELRPTKVNSVNVTIGLAAREGTTPGDLIRQRRLALGLKQADLAKLADVTQPAVSLAEQDQVSDQSESRNAILDALDAAEGLR